MSTFKRGFRPTLLSLLILGSVLWQAACSLEGGKGKKIRGHTEDYAGVMHGFAAVKAKRFCTSCHGKELQGGEDLAPSCYQCHGLNWDDKLDGTKSNAPADHTVIKDDYHHQVNLTNPQSVCSNCHGAALSGDKERLSPSCYLCHEQKWP